MIRVVLNTASTSDEGTLSKLMHPSGWEAFSLELPWRDNKSNISCIPEGLYKVHWTRSPRLSLKYGRDHFTYEIYGVKGRAGIRIHGGNLAGDTAKKMITHSLGCPLLGKTVGRLNGQRAVLVSGPTVAAFEKLMAKQSFELEVRRNGHW